MKYLLICLALALLPTPAISYKVNEKVWNHGSEDCRTNKDPAIEVFQFDAGTFILRQNKCVHFEAPFIYVLFGTRKVFVQDTGATAEADKFPLYETLQALITEWRAVHPSGDLEVLVTHSHSHRDHRAADAQFRDRPGVTLVGPNAESVRQYFGLANWPDGSATLDLGERTLTVMPLPGHQDESVAVYDSQTRWLLTGDSLCPCHLYIKDWNAYRTSIHRLVEFSQAHEISAVMGTHIEMSRTPGQAYPPGSRYQPDEIGLALSVDDLRDLDSSLRELGAKPKKKTMPKFIVYPLGTFQRIMVTILRALGVR